MKSRGSAVAEHLSDQDIANLIAHKLASGLLLAATRHIAICSLCGAKVKEASSAKVRGIAIGLITPGHLDYSQLEAYVDGSLDDVDKEIADNHLSVCDQCFHEIGELNPLKTELAAYQTNNVVEIKKRSWRNNVAAIWPANRVAQVAFALAAMLVLSFGVWFVWQSQQRQVPVAVVPGKVEHAQLSPVENTDKPPVENPGPIAALGTPPVKLNDNGTEVTIYGDGNSTGLPNLPDAQQEIVKQALSRQSFNSSSTIKDLSGHASTLMGSPSDDAGFKVLSPRGTLVKTDRPTFRWQPLTGADNYTVTVLDSDFNVLTTSPELDETEWTCSVALSRKTV